MNYIELQAKRDEMYSELCQGYDTSNMSDKELEKLHDKIITIINNKV
tara:strand:+ start:396 stop:536 length:141 start_codon:yes stop_codon:yes gene_type:complete